MSSVSAPSGGGAPAAPAPPPSSSSSGGASGSSGSSGSSGGSTSVSGSFNIQKTDSSGKTSSTSGTFNAQQNSGLGSDSIGRNSVEPHNADSADKAGSQGQAKAPEADFYNQLCKALGINPTDESDGAGGADEDGGQGSQTGQGGSGSQGGDSIDHGRRSGGIDDGGRNSGSHGGGAHGSDGPRGSGGSHGTDGSHGSSGTHGNNGSHGSNGSSSSHGSNGSSNSRGTGESSDSSGSHSSAGRRAEGPDGSGTWRHGGNTNGGVKSYQNTGSAPNKNRVNDALNQAGATNKEKALIMAMGMQEDHNFKAHDQKKDGQGDSQNYSAFNLNKYELRKLGYKGDPSRLNDSKNIGEVSKLILKGMRDPNIGTKKLMDMTRGGETAANGGGDRGDLDRWRNGQMAAANRILQAGPSAFTDGSRYVTDAGYR